MFTHGYIIICVILLMTHIDKLKSVEYVHKLINDNKKPIHTYMYNTVLKKMKKKNVISTYRV